MCSAVHAAASPQTEHVPCGQENARSDTVMLQQPPRGLLLRLPVAQPEKLTQA
jgi:hypothetical protein